MTYTPRTPQALGRGSPAVFLRCSRDAATFSLSMHSATAHLATWGLGANEN